ncbi:conserved hypothetical protein [uncultured delta proteobacterium]|uniref:DinB-like domain-containing protein n=1 Tax=uncultured delta proteobacterium TaxID=34034 RepID=A0A212JYI3_9DELT|nr:conserved hypothetical protein [uncultured delta proteobacterium]
MDPVIDVFKQEFDRFHGILLQQVDACPSEEAWLEKTGKFAYWWHFMHVLSVVEYYALPLGAPSRQKYFSRDVVMFKAEPDRALTRDEVRSLAAAMQELAHAYFATQTEKTLMAKNEGASAALGKEFTNLNALIGLVRHYNYHIGCIDSILRAKGKPGIY